MKHTLCDPAPWKRTWTCLKSRFAEIYKKNARPQARKRHFVPKFTGKVLDPYSWDSVLRAPDQSRRTWTFHKSHFVWKFPGEMPHTFSFCPHLRSRDAHGQFTGAILSRNLQGKCRTPFPGTAFCARLRSRDAHGQFTRAHFAWKFTGKWRTPFPGTV